MLNITNPEKIIPEIIETNQNEKQFLQLKTIRDT